MGPTIILDKSSLQALSKKKLILLNKLYFVNIPPILPIEILADLKRDKDEEALNEEKVIEISNKLIQKDNAINVHYLNLLISSLLGIDYFNERRTIVEGGKKVVDKDGKTGFHVVEPAEMQAIRQWQKGNFSEAEKLLAEYWRHYTKAINLEEVKRQWRNIKTIIPACPDLKTVSTIAENWLSNNNMRNELLFDIISETNIEQSYASEIYHRWEGVNNKLLKEFSPYAFYCIKVELCFKLGLVYDLITTRPTNRVDSEYFYYLPFCNIFSSRDNFHKSFAPVLLSSDQTFIDGDSLKADLKNIMSKIETENKEAKIEWETNFSLEPPDDENSFSYRMWRKYLPAWKPGWFYKKSSYPQKDEELLKKLKENISSYNQIDVNPLERFKDKNTDFITFEYRITKEDQCPCGSGKKFGNCCYRDDMRMDA